jgi:hypothetical protein
MPINFSSLGGSSGSTQGSTDFTITTGEYTNDTMNLSRDYAIGAYSMSFSPSDSSVDVYLLNDAGSVVGYSTPGAITATEAFNKITVIGSVANTSISFIYNGESQEASEGTPAVIAHAQINSVVTSSLPSVDDTTVVNGKNFAADVQVTFIGQSEVETAAKSVVRTSSTQLIITRPDSFLTADSPFTVKVVNPSLTSQAPVASGVRFLNNSVNAGTNPVWTSVTSIPCNIGVATLFTLIATDTEASDIDYSIITGTVPDGLTLDGETGVISGTFTGSGTEGNVISSVTIRAIDTGGNFLDKAFDFTANVGPTWTTAAGAISPAPRSAASYSFQLVAPTGAAGGALTYTLQSGSLLAGHSLSTTGVISGTSTAAENSTANFTVRVTDEGGLFTDRSFSMTVPDLAEATGGTVTTIGGYRYHTFTSNGTLSVSNSGPVEYLVVAGGGGIRTDNGGGGGAGGMLTGTQAVSATSYSITVGAAGNAGDGGDSIFNGVTSIGGGLGSNYNGQSNANSGGSGGGNGGSSSIGGAGTSGQGYRGGGTNNAPASGGGGGAGGTGQNNNGTAGGNGGTGRTWAANGVAYASGGGGGTGYGGASSGTLGA